MSIGRAGDGGMVGYGQCAVRASVTTKAFKTVGGLLVNLLLILLVGSRGTSREVNDGEKKKQEKKKKKRAIKSEETSRVNSKI